MRKLEGVVAKGMYIYVLAMGLFHLYTAVFGCFEAYLQRAIHLTWVLPMCFVFYSFRGQDEKQTAYNTVPWYDWVLAGLSTLPGIYIIMNYHEIMMRMQGVDDLTTAQLLLGTMLIVLLLEGTRRIVGLPIVIVALSFTVYTYFCDASFFPVVLQGSPTEFPRLIEGMYLTDEGIFSSSLGVSATFVMIFLIFGGFLEKSGVGEYFIDFAQAMTGTAAGGPAKIAVVSSALFGSISGSAVANVYGTGSFTIPLMKRIGYKPYFAAAVEAVASTGGQIMPPVMGAGAFVMAALLGVPFKTIMIAAVLPALLYYGTVLLMVHLTAVRDGLEGLPEEELPSVRSVVKRLYMMLPIVLLVYMLLAGYTPMYSAVAGIATAWGVSLLSPGKRMGPIEILQAVHDGSKTVPLVCTACASAGLVIGAIALSGSDPFVSAVLALSRGALSGAHSSGRRLAHTGHGAAYQRILYRRGAWSPRSRQDGGHAARSAPVRLLLRDNLEHHSARCPGILCRGLHRGFAAQQDGFRRLQAGGISLHSPLRFLLRPGADASGRPVGKCGIDHQRCCLHGGPGFRYSGF